MDQLLQKCNYFLLPSLYEGLSLALAEAQAALLDCFVSDTVSKMSDCGKCVFIPLDESPEFWADEICEFIKNKRVLTLDEEKLKMFDIRTMATRLSNMYSVL